MSVQEEIPQIDDELQEARRSLQETLLQVNRKVRTMEGRLSPEQLIRRNPVTSSSVAAAAGFLAGAYGDRAAVHGFIVGVLLIGVLRVASGDASAS